jgi:tetratricopeptide (TPR) repeat protein
MKATSQKQRRPQPQQPLAEGKLNKKSIYKILKLASLTACLFCFVLPGSAQSFVFQPDIARAHKLTLDLHFQECRNTLKESADAKSLQAKYVANLNEAIEILLTEDPSLFSSYEKSFEDRLIKNPKTNDEKFLVAEMKLHWSFVYLKFGHELDAASHFRDAYKIAMECRRKAPHYLPIRKTTGLLEVMVGAVPEKYNWIMDLFGMHGSIETGLKNLTEVGASESDLSKEAKLIRSLIEGYVLQQPVQAAKDLHAHLKEDSVNAFAFGASSLYIKSSQSENAIPLLKSLVGLTPLVEYSLGEVLLQRGDYQEAINAYKNFIEHYRGENNLKDAWFKTGLCYMLLTNTESADSAFAIAKKTGKEIMEADRSAMRTLNAGAMPNLTLTRVRYATDGGYYENARMLLDKIPQGELTTQKNRVEYYYRRARLEHGTKHFEASKIFYQQVIDMAGDESWYFAPNACLQMGYLFLEEKNEGRAKEYFKKALSYKHHEYKNSIDSKAKTALNRMRR